MIPIESVWRHTVRDTNGLQTNITLSADGDGARSATEHRRGQGQIRLVGEVVYGTVVGSAAVVGEVGHGFDPELVSIHRVDDQSSLVEIGLEDGRERMSLAWQERRHVCAQAVASTVPQSQSMGLHLPHAWTVTLLPLTWVSRVVMPVVLESTFFHFPSS